MKSDEMKYKLNEINIDAVCQEADAFLKKRKTESKDRIHTRLSIEEVLLNYMSAFGRDAEFTVDYGGGISKNKIRLTVPGNPVDPFSLTENASDEEQGLANILLRIGQRPRMSSRNNACLRTRRGVLKRRRQQKSDHDADNRSNG